MNIRKVSNEKKVYIDLLLLADEQESMIDKYLERGAGAPDLRSHEPQYSGYCFLPDGRYTSGVWLCNAKDYIEMQKDYQHRMMICDRDDFCVFEMIDNRNVLIMIVNM